MARTMIPLTQEDKEQSINLPLLNTLRMPTNLTTQRSQSTNVNPPSFYDEDQRKWAEKFASAIKER